MKVPFLDLRAQFATIEADVRAGWDEILANTSFILGSSVEAFESAFADFLACKHALGVGSGLSALELALRALEIGAGAEVLLPANTFIATALGVSAVGAVPVLVDMDPTTYNMDPALLESKLTEKTRAVIPVHLYGQPADMDAILAFARQHELVVLEDACQAHGARYKGKRAGTLGDMAAFSFYPGKNLGAYGDGGAVVTTRDDLAERIRLLRNYGSLKKYHHEIAGTNSRLDSLQAAVLNAKLPHLDAWNEARRGHAERYAANLADCNQVSCPAVSPQLEHVFHLYVIRAERRDDLQAYLAENEVSTGLHYPIPIHLSTAYNGLGYGPGDFPETERAAEQILTLPMYAELTADQVDYVCEQIRNFYKA